jgi:hypothetical protein
MSPAGGDAAEKLFTAAALSLRMSPISYAPENRVK